jgi:hypothetical protein
VKLFLLRCCGSLMVLVIEKSVGDDVWMQGNTRHCQTNVGLWKFLGMWCLFLPFSIGLVKWSVIEATIFFVVPIGRFLACSKLFLLSCCELEVDGDGNGRRVLMMFGCRETHDIVKQMLGCGSFWGCGVCSCLFNW